jgi:hypothetical protein
MFAGIKGVVYVSTDLNIGTILILTNGKFCYLKEICSDQIINRG